MPHKFASVLQEVAKAPRDQLDRCAFLMKLCMEAKKAANSAEDGTKPATMTAADVFVDQACTYVTGLAVSAKDVTATEREKEWDAVKGATTQILSVLPTDVSVFMKAELREAEVNSKKVGTKMKEITKVVGKGSKRAIVKLYFVCGRGGGLTGEDYEIQRCTPPSGLATIVLYRKKEGCLPTFYRSHPGPIVLTPAHWGPQDPTPAELYVVMDRGRFDFRFKIGLYSPITETWMFRNLFKLQELLYLKDSGGELRVAPNGNLIFDRVAQCTKIRRSDQKRIAGPYPCSRWGEALKYIGEANDDDWIVEPEKKDERPQSPYYTTSPILTASPISTGSSTTSPTLSIHSVPLKLPASGSANPVSSTPSRIASLPLPPRDKVLPRLATSASVITATLPPAAIPARSPSPSPSVLVAPPTALPVVHQTVTPAIISGALPIALPMASATPLVAPSSHPVYPAITPVIASVPKQPKDGIFSRAARWTKKTLGL